VCGPLVAWLANNFKPKSGQLNLRVEFEWLKVNMIFYAPFWQKIGVYVQLTSHLIIGLRKSDTDSPNLYLQYFAFQKAKLESMRIARSVTLQNPELYVLGLEEKLALAFEKRKKDIVTPLALAAAYVDPALAYLLDPPEVPGGFNALTAVMKKYYQGKTDPDEALASAMSAVQKFREKSGAFFGSKFAETLAKKPNPDEFWSAANAAEGAHGNEVCRYLVNGFAGQGSAERMNKKVKYARSANQNRQRHEVTAAMVEVGMSLREAGGPPTKTYLQHRQAHIAEIRALKAELADAVAAAAAPTQAAADADAPDQDSGDEDEDIDDVDAILADIEAEPLADETDSEDDE
jgi:hypothetical protein